MVKPMFHLRGNEVFHVEVLVKWSQLKLLKVLWLEIISARIKHL